VVYILRQIEYRWLTAHWLIVFSVLAVSIVQTGKGHIVPSILTIAALTHFVVYTWPRRWVMDIIIVACALQALGDWLVPIGIRQWINI
jgi:hypothetical protein